ncbi:uncharacterized protein LOC124964773 [Sciurus carolinensis]|uniref:uncharacterized protein LOC124964773 n=1 Tax=Sciurus carolinensis TaxID=30640 RepID=UPI001FB474A9|nr:uncharacterized protein LOC124964773 [Sciurus carolinensis]
MATRPPGTAQDLMWLSPEQRVTPGRPEATFSLSLQVAHLVWVAGITLPSRTGSGAPARGSGRRTARPEKTTGGAGAARVTPGRAEAAADGGGQSHSGSQGPGPPWQRPFPTACHSPRLSGARGPGGAAQPCGLSYLLDRFPDPHFTEAAEWRGSPGVCAIGARKTRPRVQESRRRPAGLQVSQMWGCTVAAQDIRDSASSCASSGGLQPHRLRATLQLRWPGQQPDQMESRAACHTTGGGSRSSQVDQHPASGAAPLSPSQPARTLLRGAGSSSGRSCPPSPGKHPFYFFSFSTPHATCSAILSSCFNKK